MNAITTTFDSTKEPLSELLRSIRDGKTQLPDFQRDWKWDDEHIKSLLASISLSYPIGVVMLLQTGNPDVRLQPRLVEGVPPISTNPERLVLDGQQRLTALLQSLFLDGPVVTRDARDKPIKRWYYIGINQALNPDGDRDEAIISLPEDRMIRNFRGEVLKDYSKPVEEYRAGLFPLAQILDCDEWREEHNKFWDYDKEKVKLFDAFNREVVKRFEQYQVPLIFLRKETPKEAVCQVFKKVNMGGVSLTDFELLTATYAALGFRLRDDWTIRERLIKKAGVLGNIQSAAGVLANIQSDDFLQAITLLAALTRRQQSIRAGTPPENAPGISCKSKDVLRLPLEDYEKWKENVTKGFERAARFLHGQKIFTARDLPYRTQVIPLAAVLAELGDKADSVGVMQKLARWYWCGVFGESYGGSIESTFAKDVPELLEWIAEGNEPSAVLDTNFAPSRLLTLRSRNSAAYKGLHAYLMHDGCQDFRTGNSIDNELYFHDRIDIHHIFPQDWCKANNLDAGRYDSIINKTPLAAKTNQIIGNHPPSKYLTLLEKRFGIGTEHLDQILLSHLIDPSALRKDDFETFFKSREAALLGRIELAMGKPIARDVVIREETALARFKDEDELINEEMDILEDEEEIILPGYDRIPKYHQLMNPLLKALHELGGRATVKDMLSRVSDSLRLPEDALTTFCKPGVSGQSLLANRLGWARTFLKRYGIIDNPEHGIWAIIPEKREIIAINPQEVVKTVRDMYFGGNEGLV
ncbi:MAG: DUF262 domain-containing protein [Syntrophobacteraceae bacterium]|jgi:hypothetical protein